MKKSIIGKVILLFILTAVLLIGFVGCGSIFSSTGTVYITTDIYDDYDIYMDGGYRGYTGWTGSFTIYDVPTGYHTFSAYGYYWSGSKTKYISSGSNYVTIYTN